MLKRMNIKTHSSKVVADNSHILLLPSKAVCPSGRKPHSSFQAYCFPSPSPPLKKIWNLLENQIYPPPLLRYKPPPPHPAQEDLGTLWKIRYNLPTPPLFNSRKSKIYLENQIMFTLSPHLPNIQQRSFFGGNKSEKGQIFNSWGFVLKTCRKPKWPFINFGINFAIKTELNLSEKHKAPPLPF